MQDSLKASGLELRRNLVHRRVALGLSKVGAALVAVKAMSQNERCQIELLPAIVTWTDFKYSIRDDVSRLLKRWPESARGDLPHRDVLLLQFTEAVVALHLEHFKDAAILFQDVIRGVNILRDDQLHFFAKFYLARCEYYQENYPDVERFCQDEARDLARGLEGKDLQLAVVDILTSRVIIKTKPVSELHDAIRLLKSAQIVFSKTDDHISKGNILTFLALAAKRGPHEGTEGLVRARREFRLHGEGPLPGEARVIRHRVQQLQEEMYRLNADDDYQPQPVHKKVGDHLMSETIELGPRLLEAAEEMGMAPVSRKFSKLLKEIQNHIDKGVRKESGRATREHRVSRVRQLAFGYLKRSEFIYTALGHQRGRAHNFITTGYFHLKAGNSVDALSDAERAYEIGNGNDTAQARAAILCVASAYACFEEGLEDGDYATIAVKWAEIGLKHAAKTEPRILGRAQAWYGITRLLETSGTYDRQKAEGCRDEVIDALRKFPGGSLQREFDILEGLLNSGGGQAARDLIEWAKDPRGMTWDKLENAATRRAWGVTRTIGEFIRLFATPGEKDMSYHKADGLLKRAGIDHSKCKLPKRKGVTGRLNHERAC
jgi:hypothetical protein